MYNIVIFEIYTAYSYMYMPWDGFSTNYKL